MRKITYLAVFEPSEDGYGVYFPDLPGCASFGKNRKEAHKMAEEALGLHIYGMEQDGDVLPEPSEKPVVDADTEPGYLLAPVTIYPELVKNEMDSRRVRTNTTLPAWLKSIAEVNHVNYSQLLENALMEYLEIGERKEVAYAVREKIEKDKDHEIQKK